MRFLAIRFFLLQTAYSTLIAVTVTIRLWWNVQPNSMIYFRLNEHRAIFRTSALLQISVSGLEGNDLALIDPSLDIPTFVTGKKGSETFGGWLVPGQTPIGGHHSKNGIIHLVIAAEFLQTGRIATTLERPPTIVALDTVYVLGTSSLAWPRNTLGVPGHEGHWFVDVRDLLSARMSGRNDNLAADAVSGHLNRLLPMTSHMDGNALGTPPTYRIHKPG